MLGLKLLISIVVFPIYYQQSWLTENHALQHLDESQLLQFGHARLALGIEGAAVLDDDVRDEWGLAGRARAGAGSGAGPFGTSGSSRRRGLFDLYANRVIGGGVVRGGINRETRELGEKSLHFRRFSVVVVGSSQKRRLEKNFESWVDIQQVKLSYEQPFPSAANEKARPHPTLSPRTRHKSITLSFLQLFRLELFY